MNIRWVTWWPAPYWIPRFEALANRPGVDLEVIFLAGSSTRQEWQIDPSTWKFDSQFFDRRPSRGGYYEQNLRIGPFWRLLRNRRNTSLVLLHADPTCAMAAMISRVFRMPYHIFVDNTVDDARSGHRAKELMKGILFGGAKSAIATGPLQGEYARRYLRRRAPVGIVGSPVDTVAIRRRLERQSDDRKELRQERGWTDRFVIAYVGRLSPEKSLPVLLKAASRVAGHGVPVTVAFAGSGPLQNELREWADTLGVQLDLLGFVEGDRLARVYAAADTFVLPSQSESWGLVVNEAMEYALPVVVSDHVGARHLIDPGRSGFITKTGDADALAAVLVSLATDTALRSRIGAAARLAVVDQTVEHWADNVIRHLEAHGSDST